MFLKTPPGNNSANKNAMGKISLTLISLVLFAFALPCMEKAGAYDLEITGYHVEMEVLKDNSYRIHETIDVTFYNPRMRGIIREIPNRTYFGKPVQIRDIEVPDRPVTQSTRDDFLSLRIGDPDRFARARETYLISYHYIIGDDHDPDMDELYFNIIGTHWEIPIHKTTFSITMPKPFNPDDLNFTRGSEGSASSEGVESKIIIKNILTYCKTKYRNKIKSTLPQRGAFTPMAQA